MAYAFLSLIKTDTGDYWLQGAGDPSRNADFSIFALDGEGGDPFAVVCGKKFGIVTLPKIPARGVRYDTEDLDSFFRALNRIILAAKKAAIPLPDYVD